ncbi:AAA family ATPase [Haliea sp.]|jgi:hypothetical protein|uniref:AAA family ATPase n=1 Tax=Haliea sp. TaxID=1932666 RepID=UPI000C4FBC0D|nr:AAA family ATPase [Haliea sp.]HCD56563.1 hypothetical protein [Halieaceae bacterium]MAD65183.1 hypothetical protein [Haliea sp.]MAY92945.1 hypothetical protein [Haliea sp.]MBK40432.1 hypothetical protein [Haliea sp.]MBP68817.1 hypothetical protein [Haliea sp.]|tara:strand:+ start:5585 stop:6640 length:1056 start_codon:yes stop_codon:yes gene_type:complete
MSSFGLIPVSTLTAAPPLSNWLIKDVIEKQAIGMAFGQPGTAKSFFLMDMSFCVSNGIDWHGHKTTKGNVIYLAGEGFSGMKARFRALEIKYGMTGSGLFISNGPAHLSDLEHAQAVYNEITRVCPDPALIIIDTLHRNFGDGDENSARDLGRFLTTLTALTQATGASIFLAHHSGHASSGRARGSSALRAAMDVEYKLEKSGQTVTVSCTKAKEHEAPEPACFELQEVVLPGWFDDEGIPLKSAILQPTTYTPTASKPALSEREQKVLQALQACIEEDGWPPERSHIDAHPALLDRKSVQLDTWRFKAYEELRTENVQPASIRQAFLRAREKLANEAKVLIIDDFCYSLE